MKANKIEYLETEIDIILRGRVRDELVKTIKAEIMSRFKDSAVGTTLQDAKEYLKKNFNEGCSCPACGQFVRLYKRKLGSPQARGLILLYSLHRSTGKEWIHIRKIIEQVNVHGDFAKMVYWGLIEEHSNEDEDKKNSGLWRITEKGKRFVRNEIKIPSHALVFNGKLQGFSGTTTDIVDSLGKKFSYRELMAH